MDDDLFSEAETTNLKSWSSIMDDYGAWGRGLKYVGSAVKYTMAISAGLVLLKEPIMKFLGWSE